MYDPYKPPEEYRSENEDDNGAGSGLYDAVNAVYALFVLGSSLVLIYGQRFPFDDTSAFLAVIFWAPTCAYFLVKRRYARVLRYFLYGHAALVVSLIYIFITHIGGQGLNQGIGNFMVLVNSVSLAANYRKWRELAAGQR